MTIRKRKSTILRLLIATAVLAVLLAAPPHLHMLSINDLLVMALHQLSLALTCIYLIWLLLLHGRRLITTALILTVCVLLLPLLAIGLEYELSTFGQKSGDPFHDTVQIDEFHAWRIVEAAGVEDYLIAHVDEAWQFYDY